MLNRILIMVLLVNLLACQPQTPKTITTSAFQIASGKPVVQGTELNFPNDHGIHPEQGIEWWYITANLEAETGETFGVQWTLFRTLMPANIESTWWDNNLYFAHFAMQHQQQHVAFEHFARAGQAQVISSPFTAKINHWQLASKTNNFLPLQLSAKENDYQVSLTLDNSPLSLHGKKGYSQKTQSGHASYYFSYPFLDVNGDLTFAGKQYKVTGNAWYDREWSASLLDKNQLGWDWFSLVDSTKKRGLMLFCIRGKKQHYDYCSGSHINAEGKTTEISQEEITVSVIDTQVLDGRHYPSQWQIELSHMPSITIETITKDARNQLSIPYWEGRIKASGGFHGKGYAELTGY